MSALDADLAELEEWLDGLVDEAVKQHMPFHLPSKEFRRAVLDSVEFAKARADAKAHADRMVRFQDDVRKARKTLLPGGGRLVRCGVERMFDARRKP
jgi:hypothetical protein